MSQALPPSLTRAQVLSALHDHSTLMSLQPLVTSFEKTPAPADPDTDPHFSGSSAPLLYYTIKESIPILPFLGAWGSYPISFPAIFQDNEEGTKSKALAAMGVTVRNSWAVRHVEGKGEGDGGQQEWELVEDAEVECPGWLMPFVGGSMEKAHREMFGGFMDRVMAVNAGPQAT
ncbi:hypothetical protein LTS18_011942 [Coniosporium uncinatum]|uniref:Uncharacterized protein n=1 Tax=Coniosporium uncinatum TaxID=93489 RepID=A0ACC3DVT4_9PEZI|nr:hypothetical protein LTS18_011942 [Coniosporium uncinatum]